MTRLRQFSLAIPRTYRDVALWLAATYGVLRLADLPGDGGLKVLCGPWGCLPPLQALAAAHGFWLMVVVPALIGAKRRVSTEGLGRLGLALIALGGSGIAATVIRSLIAWGPLTADRPWWHPALHALFDVAMFVDLPLVEFMAAGVACVTIARVERKRNHRDDPNRSKSADSLNTLEAHPGGDIMEIARDATHP